MLEIFALVSLLNGTYFSSWIKYSFTAAYNLGIQHELDFFFLPSCFFHLFICSISTAESYNRKPPRGEARGDIT